MDFDKSYAAFREARMKLPNATFFREDTTRAILLACGALTVLAGYAICWAAFHERIDD